jgi:hypothetical protein
LLEDFIPFETPTPTTFPIPSTCEEIVSGSSNRKLEFLKEEAGGGGARDGKDVHGIVGGTQVRHPTDSFTPRDNVTDSPLNTSLFSMVYAQAEVGRYSYIVRLNMGTFPNGALDSPYCGGSLVAPDVVLTAAVSFCFQFALSKTELIRS